MTNLGFLIFIAGLVLMVLLIEEASKSDKILFFFFTFVFSVGFIITGLFYVIGKYYFSSNSFVVNTTEDSYDTDNLIIEDGNIYFTSNNQIHKYDLSEEVIEIKVK